jgi:hypothetical protein
MNLERGHEHEHVESMWTVNVYMLITKYLHEYLYMYMDTVKDNTVEGVNIWLFV